MYAPIKVPISKRMLKNALERDCGQMNAQSFMKGKGNVVGFLGEEMVLSLSPEFKIIDSYDYDLTFKGFTFDVKTKHQTVDFEPKSTYDASICSDSLHQKTQYYIFCRVFRDGRGNYPYGWVIGFISKNKYFKNALSLKKGDLDPSNNFTVRQDCFNLKYKSLFPIKTLLDKNVFH